jgi:hypothetical protein
MIRFLLLIAVLLGFATALPSVAGWPSSGRKYPLVTIPAPALAAGYTLNTFSTQSSFNTGTVDIAATNTAGWQWYIWKYFGSTQSATPITLNSDGTVTISNSTGYNGTLTSTVPIATSPYFHGTAYGGGGYFEAELAFDAAGVVFTAGWPSWWSMSNEHLIGDYGDQWTGQATGYVHFDESDFMEYDITQGSSTFGSTFHEYWGIVNVTCTSFCTQYATENTTPAGVNFSLYHKYGFLWIPATATTLGAATIYFDGVNEGTLTWTQFTTQAPPPTSQTWAYGVIDAQHLALILGNGSAARMQIRSVNVWQATAANNTTN